MSDQDSLLDVYRIRTSVRVKQVVYMAIALPVMTWIYPYTTLFELDFGQLGVRAWLLLVLIPPASLYCLYALSITLLFPIVEVYGDRIYRAGPIGRWCQHSCHKGLRVEDHDWGRLILVGKKKVRLPNSIFEEDKSRI